MTRHHYVAYCARCGRLIRGHNTIPILCVNCGKAQEGK